MIISTTWIEHLFNQYGYIGIFFLFSFGIIGLPVPDETLLVIIGFLMAQSYLPIIQTCLVIYLGVTCGITLSYLLGMLVRKELLFRLIGKFGITEEKLNKGHIWFEKRGKWSLLIGYYVPGIRHLIGIAAGTTRLYYREFALFAYSGALIWSTTFLAIGYFFSQQVSGWFHF